ncbi:TPA: restriction endonuclease subunit S [Clostridioides difficile]
MEYIKLNELCYINIGKTPSRNTSDYWGSGNRWLSISDLKEKYISKSKEEITDLAVEKANMKLVPKNTVVMSFKLSIGRVAILKEDMFTNEAIANFQIKNNELITSEYLYYALRTLNFNNTDRAVMGATLNKSKLNDIKIPYFTICIQNKMVEVLNKAQELINKRKEQIEALDELVKSRFIEMFGNFKEQKFVLLKDCTNFIDYRGKTPILSENGIRIINAKSVGNGVFKYINEYISENTYNSWMKRGFPVAGDVLFVTEGHTFGNVCRIPKDLKKFAMGQRIITIQGDKKILNNAFLAQYMQTKAFRVEIDKYKTGSSAQGIRSKELQKILIPVPSIELQNKFEEFVNQVDKLKVGIKISLKELEDNFNSLMQKAFKGELFN